jgi:hypothetical protein
MMMMMSAEENEVATKYYLSDAVSREIFGYFGVFH